MRLSAIRRLVAILVVVALSLSFALGAGAQNDGTPTPTDQTTLPGRGTCAALAAGTPRPGGMLGSPMAGMPVPAAFDLMFIDMMIPHHQGAIAMAQVALERAEREEVRALAEVIIRDQQAEIDQMREWRDAWYPGAAAMPMDQLLGMMGGMMPGMPGRGTMGGMMGTPGAGMGIMDHLAIGMMAPQADARTLCTASGSVDETFIRMMIPHHQGAIAMAQVAQQQASHPELQQLAETMITEQEAEIAQMQEWLAAWYGSGASVASPAT